MQTVNSFVAAYLKKKGFKEAEQLLEDLENKESGPIDFHNDPDLDKFIHHFSHQISCEHECLLCQCGKEWQSEKLLSTPEDEVARYQDGYSKLRSWTYSSLDLYKHELLRLLYPVFIHWFMDLAAKGYLQEGEEMEFARSLRQNKVNIKICQYSYDLLLQYLHKSSPLLCWGSSTNISTSKILLDNRVPFLMMQRF